MKFLTTFSQSPTKVGYGKQKWDDKAYFIMKGKKIIIKDYVQENAEGTDFYTNLEKFGNLETTIEFMSKNRAELVENFTEAVKLQDIEDRRIELLNIWERLPIEIRDSFNNDFSSFMTNGAKFFDEQAKILETEIANSNQRQTEPNNKSENKETTPPKENASGNETK